MNAMLEKINEEAPVIDYQDEIPEVLIKPVGEELVQLEDPIWDSSSPSDQGQSKTYCQVPSNYVDSKVKNILNESDNFLDLMVSMDKEDA